MVEKKTCLQRCICRVIQFPNLFTTSHWRQRAIWLLPISKWRIRVFFRTYKKEYVTIPILWPWVYELDAINLSLIKDRVSSWYVHDRFIISHNEYLRYLPPLSSLQITSLDVAYRLMFFPNDQWLAKWVARMNEVEQVRALLLVMPSILWLTLNPGHGLTKGRKL